VGTGRVHGHRGLRSAVTATNSGHVDAVHTPGRFPTSRHVVPRTYADVVLQVRAGLGVYRVGFDSRQLHLNMQVTL
jgi:hypothetical protein